MEFAGKVVLITGASSGIGAETARYFAKRGATLSLAGRNEQALKKVGSDCGNDPLMTCGDLTDDEYVRRLVEATLRRFGRLDVLVNNAGTSGLSSVHAPRLLEEYDRTFSLNVRSVLLLTSLAAPHLEASGGSVVNVSSINGLRPYPGMLAYCMSKSAVDQLTRCSALELAPKGVRVNAVNPGTIDTPLHDRAGMPAAAYLQRAKGFHPLGRVGRSEEVAAAVGFLAGDGALFITGVTLSVDGGRHCAVAASVAGYAPQ